MSITPLLKISRRNFLPTCVFFPRITILGNDTNSCHSTLIQILCPLILFNHTNARLSPTSWIWEFLPFNPILIALIGCCADELPPLGSYYDFMNRFWNDSRENYSHTCLLNANRNINKPKKVIGANGKLIDQSLTHMPQGIW
ncbi:MAG: hypothetical protein K2N44_12290 [Lachnospiraceae bacterium]|nr:hypothetical protein [Lachnospiraceae bacterium]